ncbi:MULTISPECIES: ribose-5-phosphate isomerase RpiA [Pseudovibrio]|uniref:ribose-5-phosphate isomerase RpiA n=1 Tax=Stappiaceae TaxID=2821832 RepID=UPI0023661C6D|nr:MULTISPECIES: ribose-5-phosphate isomerase RpiA [Pseudovibrio]MDD7908976.1 ribose-5-phosphate isomerase RpiA [Pseudovibrio exalbescens]MDX5593703.1 ribose-5-phosphate isomerase RpiA [Pseudovibrio sp. SPO723]
MSAALKVEAAAAALKEVKSGMRLGIGSGSTVNELIKLLAEEVKGGLDVVGVPASEASASLCRELGVPLTTLNETPELDLCIDGADEIAPGLALIKGGGAALLREKMIVMASQRFIVIADQTKIVETLGTFPLPIEVVQFGLGATRVKLEKHVEAHGLAGELVLRGGADAPLVTDNGNYIIDAHLGSIPDPEAFAAGLNDIPGVVENGLFINLAMRAYVAGTDQVKIIER